MHRSLVAALRRALRAEPLKPDLVPSVVSAARVLFHYAQWSTNAKTRRWAEKKYRVNMPRLPGPKALAEAAVWEAVRMVRAGGRVLLPTGTAIQAQERA